MIRIALVLLLASVLPGCATIVDGSSQWVAISTDPEGADCTVERNGMPLGEVNPTPGNIHIGKSKHDLSVVCTRGGYQSATVAHASKFQAMTFGNILFGGLVGVIVDAATGADFEYPTYVRVDLKPEAAAAAPVRRWPRPLSPVCDTGSDLRPAELISRRCGRRVLSRYASLVLRSRK